MIVNIGDVIESDFGKGKIVAITKEWIVHECGDSHEAALSIDDRSFWVPAEPGEQGTAKESLEI